MRDGVPMQIGLFDAMGGGNLGDAAIQDSVIANIRSRLPQTRIVGFSFAPDDTTKRHGIPCHPITRHARENAPATTQARGPTKAASRLKSAFKRVPFLHAMAKPLAEVVREGLFLTRSYRAVRSLDVLIMSGGGQICELWGGPWAHLCNLFKFSVLTKLAGKKLYFLNVGAEPLEHRMSRFFAKSAVRLADYVSFRDAHSQTLVQNLGVKAKTHVHPDPVYALEVTRYLEERSAGSSTPTVGINPLGYCDPRIWPRKEQRVYEAYLDKLTRFSLWLLEQRYRLKLFTTSPAADKYAVADLKRRLLERPAADGSMAPTSGGGVEGVKAVLCESVKEVLEEMSGCDFIVTSRYHGVVFAHLLSKPVIALSYQRKSDVAMQPVGLGQFSASIEHFETDWLIDTFRSLVITSKAVQSREAGAVAAYADTLRKQFDDLFSL